MTTLNANGAATLGTGNLSGSADRLVYQEDTTTWRG